MAEEPREDGLEDAGLTALRAEMDPLGLAAENAGLRSAQRGAYAVIRALAARLGGDVLLTAAELDGTTDKLQITAQPNRDVSVVVERAS